MTPLVSNTRFKQLYVLSTIGIGIITLAHSLITISSAPIDRTWFILAGLTLLTGSFTVKIPSIPARLSVSETFVFSCVLLFGPAPATLLVTLESLVAALWFKGISRTFYRVAFNVSASTVSISIAAHLFYTFTRIQPLSVQHIPILPLVVPLLILTVIYFLSNSWLIATAISFEQHLPVFDVWRANFMWLSLNYFGAASVAALLSPYANEANLWPMIGIIVPLLLISYLTFKTSMGRVEDANNHLRQLNTLYLSTIETLAMAIDAKDQITHGHIRRVQHYAMALARASGVSDVPQLKAIEAAALLHDMGKLAVPEYILNKPGKLTAAEFDKMKLHASVGADILAAIDFPFPVVPIVRHHHENWDGTGYPSGLKNTDIPIGARILAVVDCFDALTSDRPYRPRLPQADAIHILKERRGTMYDPVMVDIFVQIVSGISRPQSTTLNVSLHTITEAASSLPSSNHEVASGLEHIAAGVDEMLVLYDLARALAGQINLSDAGDIIAKHLRRIVPGSLFVFYVYDATSDELIARHASGEHAHVISGIRLPFGQRLTGWVAANRQTIVNSDPILDFGDLGRSLRPRLQSCLSTPMLDGEQLVGVLAVYASHQAAYCDDHRRIVEVVSRQVSRTIMQAVLFDSRRRKVFSDEATGLPNRARLIDFFTTIKTKHSELAAPLSILLVSVSTDRVPVSHVHGFSDLSLIHIANTLRRALRAGDILFKFDATEFVVLLIQTDAFTASLIRSRIGAELVTTSSQAAEPTASLTVAIGISTLPDDGADLQDAVSSARRRVLIYSGNEFMCINNPSSVH